MQALVKKERAPGLWLADTIRPRKDTVIQYGIVELAND